ncbi:TonB-dependent receptor [bacterium]|nr:TonB-dependent receptor [bacterium]
MQSLTRASLLALAAVSSATAADTLNLDPVVVTATRTETRNPVAPTLVITRADIQRSLATDVAELLRQQTGIEIGRNGGPGQTTSVFIRGAESNHTLVLIDGVRVNPGTLGSPAVQNIDPDVIERIEIVKGPRSALYGSDAIGGVVNIITRAGTQKTRIELDAGAGRLNTTDGGIAVTGLGLRASLRVHDTGGYPPQEGSDDTRGYDNTTAQLAFDRKIGPVAISARALRSTGNVEYLDFFLAPVDQDFRNAVYELAASATPVSGWATSLSVSRSVDEIEQQQSIDFATTWRTLVDWQNDIQLADGHLLTAGLTANRESINTTTGAAFGFPSSFGEDRETDSAYLQHQWTTGRHTLVGAARYSDHSSFGSETTWNIDYGVGLWRGGRLIVGAGTGFRAPDLTDLFGFGGNPNFGPETSDNYELGFEQRFNRHWLLDVALFRNDIDNLIEVNTVTFATEQVERARIEGVEATLRFDTANWQARLGGIVQSPKNLNVDQDLGRRARRTANFSLVRQLGTVQLGVDALASSERRDSRFSPNIMAGYVLTGLTAQWQVMPDLAVQARLENALDTDYETADGFPGQERTAYARMRYVWGATTSD